MSKRVKLFALTAALLILISGLVAGGIAIADSSTPTPAPTTTPTPGTMTPQADALWAKVASILGIDQQKLGDAVKQARQEMVTDRINTILDNAVKAGKITADQSSQIRDWIKNRPSALSQLPEGIGSLLGRMNLGKGITEQDLISKVATILGIDQQKLIDAVKQARSELANAAATSALDKKLDDAVAKGIIT